MTSGKGPWIRISLLPLVLGIICLAGFAMTLHTVIGRDFVRVVAVPATSGLLYFLSGLALFYYLHPRAGLYPLLFFHFLVANLFILFPEFQTTPPVSYFILVCLAFAPPTLIHFTSLFSEALIQVRKRPWLYLAPYLISLLLLGPYLYAFMERPSWWVSIRMACFVYLALAYLLWIFRLLWILKTPHLELDRMTARYFLIGQLVGFIIPLLGMIVIIWLEISFPFYWAAPLILLFPFSILLGIVPAKRRLQETYIVQSEKRQSFGNLLAGLSHEIKNPLNFIYSNMEPLKESLQYVRQKISNPDPRTSEVLHDLDRMVDNMEEGVSRVKTLVEKFRFFPNPRPELKEDVDLNAVIDRSIELLSPKWKGRINIQKKLDAIPKVRGFPGELGQMFTNLIANACDATPEGGVVSISTHRAATGIKILIQDTGKGISKEDIGRIFDPFFTTKHQGEGTGLGLAIAQQIIKSHRGSIEVKSELGKGTEFLLVFSF